MGVMNLNPISSRAFCVCDERSYVEKGTCLELEAEALGAVDGSSTEVDWAVVDNAFSVSVEGISLIGGDVIPSFDFFIEEEEEPFIFNSFNFDLLFFLEIGFDVDSIGAAMAWTEVWEESCFWIS